jgi:hypothetical protein
MCLLDSTLPYFVRFLVSVEQLSIANWQLQMHEVVCHGWHDTCRLLPVQPQEERSLPPPPSLCPSLHTHVGPSDHRSSGMHCCWTPISPGIRPWQRKHVTMTRLLDSCSQGHPADLVAGS